MTCTSVTSALEDARASREVLEQLHDPTFGDQGKVRTRNESKQNAVSLSRPVPFTWHTWSEKEKSSNSITFMRNITREICGRRCHKPMNHLVPSRRKKPPACRLSKSSSHHSPCHVGHVSACGGLWGFERNRNKTRHFASSEPMFV
jgi:hypothetical protein